MNIIKNRLKFIPFAPLLLCAFFSPAISLAQTMAKTTEAIKTELDSVQAQFVSNLQSAASSPEQLEDGTTVQNCEKILQSLEPIILRIGEVIDMLSKKEAELGSMAGLGESEVFELKAALQEQRKPLENYKRTALGLQKELQALIGGKVAGILEVYSQFHDVAGKEKAKEKVMERINPIVAPYLPPTPKPTPTPVADATSVDAPTPAPSSDASLTTAKAIATADSGNWNVYKPGRMPRGRLIDISYVPKLVQQGTGGERIYLRGDFDVTAAGGDRAVLRPSRQRLDGADNIRIIVYHPKGMSPPTDGSSISRDNERPFQILDVRKSPGGQVNVYAREVTEP